MNSVSTSGSGTKASVKRSSLPWQISRTSGCYGMWVLTDEDNAAAMHTYAAAGATDPQKQTMLSWTFARR